MTYHSVFVDLFEQIESIQLAEQKETLLKRLADTEAENAVSFIGAH